MVDRENIRSKVQENVEVIKTGNWYVAKASYDGQEFGVQNVSEEAAIDELVSKFHMYEKGKEHRKNRRELASDVRQALEDIESCPDD